MKKKKHKQRHDEEEEDLDEEEDSEVDQDEDEDEEEEDRPRKKKRRDGKRKKTKKLGPHLLDAPDGIPDYQKEQWDTINDFEHKSWSPSNEGLTTGFAGIDFALKKLQAGFHIIAGDSNIGKTSFVSQLAWNVATLNRDRAYVIDFSLDDPMQDKMSRIIASGMKVLINAVKTPKEYKQYPNMLKRRRQGLRALRDMIDCYKCYDQNHSTDVEVIKKTIKEHMVALKEAGEDRKVVVFIDNFHDLTTDHPDSKGSDKAKYDFLAQFIADMAIEFDIAIVCTAEFKKMNGFRRPGVDDIRESVKIKYEAKSIMLCYNEVSLKGEAASVYFEKQGEAEKQAVFEVHFGKNKYSKFKGRVFFEGYPEMAYFVEADREASKRYMNAIYSNE